MVISRDITFDKSTFDFSMDRSSGEGENATMDLDLLEIEDDDVSQTVYKQTGKCKHQARGGMSRSACHQTGLEESSTPEQVLERRQQRRSSTREIMSEDEEEKHASIDDQDDRSAPPTFWRASAIAVGAMDLAEPANFPRRNQRS